MWLFLHKTLLVSKTEQKHSTKRFWPPAKNEAFSKWINISWLQHGPRWRLEHLLQVFDVHLKHLHTFPETLCKQMNYRTDFQHFWAARWQTRDTLVSQVCMLDDKGMAKDGKGKLFLETHRDHLILVNSVFIFIFQVNLPNVDFF